MTNVNYLIIDGQPVTKKNSQRILINRATGKPFIAPSDKFKKYEKAAQWQIYNQWRGKAPIDHAVNVKCVFFMENKRRVDLTNLLESIDDILVAYRVLEDDHCGIIASHDGSRVCVDKYHPRVEVTIEDFVSWT